MNGVTGDPTQTCEIFGSSNAGSFMRQVQAAVDASPDTSQIPVTTTKELPLNTQSARQLLDDPDLMFLPPKGLADALMLSYWDNQWQLYPIIPRREIETIYESLWGSTTMEHLQLAHVSLISICFALGCQYCQLLQPDKRIATGSHFFARADRLHQKLEDGPSLTKVQYLLLSGIYLQSTNKVFQCWMTVGQAIRMAQSLGLHLSQPQPSSETIIQSEYRRRTWHGCVWLDCVLSATFGRPGLIAGFLSESVPLPSMVDDEDLNGDSGTLSGCSNDSHLRITFFVEAIKLYRILGEVLARLYLISMRNDKFQSNLVQIVEIDGQLQSWQESLPKHLRDHSIAENDAVLKRQSIVLRIRFLHVRTLLFRPALIHHCQSVNLDHTPDTSLAQCLITQCSQLCFRIAREVINIFHCNLDAETLGGPVPCWWYSVLSWLALIHLDLYTAATVVFVERYLEKKNGLTTESPASLAWDAALSVLRSYSILGGSAKKCVSSLEYLSEKLPNEKGTADTEIPQDHLAENMSALWEMPDLFSGNVDLTDSALLPFDLGGMTWLDSL
ncbi:unnamed protein product [Clonostachys solani]|uniref:Xylanolytic transcriptional activator regulatory domain-containing protein n=1 Tax=Clonostachys solani TaxID=160281 RepID=A0A9N9Z0K6_9HYPO|nr:unnamed protein product [Clonostachys solani]